MRIEELQNNLLIKTPDTVEKYLLNIIQQYFKNTENDLEGSREFIITEAVKRMQNELDYNSLGVLSITLPNGEVRKGDVELTLEDFGGEPLISNKLSAFNVNFGTIAGTACEGNDYRLYNARPPIKHTHTIQDITGLEGMLSTIVNQMNKTDIYQHTHDNMDVLNKLTYSGNKTSIDLAVLDGLEDLIDEQVLGIKTKIIQYNTATQNSINDINASIELLDQSIDALHEYVINKCSDYLAQSKSYTDSVFDNVYNNTVNYITNNFVLKDDVQDLIELARKCYTLVGTQKWSFNDILFQTDDDKKYAKLSFDQSIIDELQKREIAISTSENTVFKFFVEYQKNNITYKRPLPILNSEDTMFESFMFPEVNKQTVSGYIKIMMLDDLVCQAVLFDNGDKLEYSVLNNSNIVCDIFAKDILSSL